MDKIKSVWELQLLAILASLVIIKLAQPVLFPLLFSLFLYLLINPILDWLISIKIPKVIASILIVGGLFALISLAVTFLLQPASKWIEKAPENFRIIEHKFSFVKKSLGQISKAAETAKNITEDTKNEKVTLTTDMRSIGFSIFDLTTNILFLIFTILLFLFFLFLYFKPFIHHFENAFFRQKKEKENIFLMSLQNEVSRYMFIFTLICAGLGAVMAFVFWLLDFPNALLWGVMIMVLTFIPYLGHLVGILIIFFVSLISYDSYLHIFAPPLIYLLFTALEGQVITPILLGNRLNLNPLIIFFSIFLWGWLWGVSGVLISVPILVTLKIVFENIPSLARYKILLEK